MSFTLGGLRAAEAQAVPAPTPGAIEPCITRVELHKATMARQLLLIGFTGFFLGVCFCSCCVGALWCLLSVVSWSPEDGVTNRVHTDRCDSLFQRARPTIPLRGLRAGPHRLRAFEMLVRRPTGREAVAYERVEKEDNTEEAP